MNSYIFIHFWALWARKNGKFYVYDLVCGRGKYSTLVVTLIFKSCGKLKRISRRKFWVLPHVKNILKRHRNSYLNFWEQTKNCQVSNYFCTLCTNRVVKSKFLSKNPFFGLEWLVLCIYRPNNLMFHLRTQYWGLRKPQKGSKWPIFRGLNQLHLLGGFFGWIWVEHHLQSL